MDANLLYLHILYLHIQGDVDVICGGPPCQGISGYNRFRNVDAPLTDERNHQLVVFMDIVKFLKPRYVLMENVTDILRFDKGSLGRYALSRMVDMKYQARLGIMPAAGYGLPQFRLRVFLWGALPSEVSCFFFFYFELETVQFTFLSSVVVCFHSFLGNVKLMKDVLLL